MVQKTVNIPHGLLNNALTTDIDNPARVNIKMNNTAKEATLPALLPISFLAIKGKLRPWYLTDAKSDTIS